MIILLPNALTLDDSMIATASRRFAEAFCLAWARIPADAQAVILGYLQRHPGRVFMCYRMNLADDHPERWANCTWCEGQTFLTFLAPFVEGANPIDGVVSVIVHELAHWYRRGAGNWTEDCEAEERGVRQVTEAWGIVDPTPGTGEARLAWDREIERWRWRRRLEFGDLTERELLKRQGFVREGQDA